MDAFRQVDYNFIYCPQKEGNNLEIKNLICCVNNIVFSPSNI